MLIYLIFALAIGYTGYIIYEKILVTKLRKSFKYVIHVNGIRGKSSTTRLIDAGMRGCGYKVFSKTTGTIPCIIDVDNNDVVIKRRGSANIREQIKMLKMAKNMGAEVVVLECMAVNPYLQYICEKHILKSDVTIITNVRKDHILEMGETLDDIAYAFCNTIPTNGTLVITDGEYNKLFTKCANKLNTKTVIAKDYPVLTHINTFKENINVSLACCEALKLDVDKFLAGMFNYHEDYGAFAKYKIGKTCFYNAFSANDPESTLIVFNSCLNELNLDNLCVLLNNRDDRPVRLMQHIKLLKKIPFKKLFIMGSNTNYLLRKVKSEIKDCNVEIIKDPLAILNEECVFGIGNIAGEGMKLLDYFKERGKRL